MIRLKMPPRTPSCGPVSVSRVPGGMIHVSAQTMSPDGSVAIDGGFTCSEHNAWRLLGMLSLILGVPLSREAGKAVML